MPEQFGRQSRSGRRAGRALALALVLGGGLGACGGDGGEADAIEPEVPIRGNLDNEDVIAPAAEVVEGLGVIKGLVDEVVAAVGSDAALDLNDSMVPVWESVEGRVKSEDPDAHTQFEAQFIALTAAAEAQDKTKARAAGDALIKLVDDYLAGKRTTSTASPSASPSSIPSPSSTVVP